MRPTSLLAALALLAALLAFPVQGQAVILTEDFEDEALFANPTGPYTFSESGSGTTLIEVRGTRLVLGMELAASVDVRPLDTA